MRPTPLLLSLSLLAACEVVPEEPVGLPTVEGLTAAIDLDPSDDVAEYAMTVREERVELVSGQTVDAFTYDGLTPGPLLQAWVGQTVRIHVTNELDEPTTVHWHGLRISAEMDGVVMGSVQAIEPGASFTYEFVPPEAGTFWYHPHVRTNVQVEAGLYGALVVHELDDVAPVVDADRVFVLDDILLEDDGSIAPESFAGMTGMHGRFGNTLLVNGQEDPITGTIPPEGVERWRLVNTSNARTMVFRFPGLRVREIGADGGLWRQAWTRSVDQVVLPVGARAELEVRLDGESGSLQQIVLALNSNNDVVEVEIDRALIALDAEAEASVATGFTADPPMADYTDGETFRLELDGINTMSGLQWRLNGQVWPDTADWLVARDTPTIIEIANLAGPEHPFHMHGQLFSVLDRDGVEADEKGLRDTVLVGGQSTVRIATEFDNPGMWMVHCHILEHAELGMMTTVEVLP